MIKRKRSLSLHAKMLLAIAAGLLCAVAVYLGGSELSEYIIDKAYMKDDAVAGRNRQHVRNFEEFVSVNNLASTDRAAIASWTKEQENVYMVFYKDDAISFEAGWWGIDNSKNYAQYYAAGRGGSFFPVRFSDGTVAVAIYDYSQNRIYSLWELLSLIAACAVLVIVLFLYDRYLVRRIIALSTSVNRVSGGDMQREIPASGHGDELSRLASDVDNMRRSILERAESEKTAWQANSNLITALSHDIRTPLTMLLGYMDIIENGQYKSQEELKRYLEISRSKALQLKELTDKLFYFFLVFANPTLTTQKETYRAQPLLDQLLGENIIPLEQKGFEIKMLGLTKHCEIETDVDYLKRVFDNLFSNVEKHADASRPVTIVAAVEDDELCVWMSNYISPGHADTESTQIGVNTCRRLMQQLGGRLEIFSLPPQYTAGVVIPLKKQG